MYEITSEIVVLNRMSLSEWLLIFFDKVPGLNSWPMKDKFTLSVCQNKFIYTGKDFEGTLTIFENHGRLRSMPNPTTILQLKMWRNALEPSDLEITIKSIFSTACDSLLQLFDIYNNIQRQKSKKLFLSQIKTRKLYIATSSFLKNDR